MTVLELAGRTWLVVTVLGGSALLFGLALVRLYQH